METKREMIFNQPDMKGLLHSVVANPIDGEPAVLVDSQEYSALGCDLRNLRKLGKLLRSVVDLEDSMILCIAEDSTCYMRMEAANALISWTSGLSTGDYSTFLVNSGGGHRGRLTICRRNLLCARTAQP
jgi:tRNA wybutosine-synthesizing protein 4